ncbi:MAG: uroporphyrinogen decarboxylase family protein [Christensenellales bacterium]
MTPKQRFLTALDRGIPDRVPTFELEFQLTPELLGKEMLCEDDLKGKTASEAETLLRENAKLLIEVYTRLEHDAICIQYLSKEHIAMTAKYIHEYSGDTFALFCHGDGTLAIPDGDGLYELSYAMYEDPEGLHEKCRKMADTAIANNAYLLDNGLDGFILCSDYCFNQGPFMSPKQFSQFVTPYLRDIIASIRAKGGYAIKHTDGNIMPILDQLVSCNPHALHSIDPMAGVDIRIVKEMVGDKVALCGNVHCAAMQTGTEQDVIDSAEYCLKHAKPGGGYIYCTSNIPFRGLPLERYLLVLDVWKKHRDY